LVDRGANGGILGNDARVILKHQKSVDVTGIDNHELNSLRIVDGAAKIGTQYGPVIAILRQYAYHGLERTIHSAGQLEHYKQEVNDRSLKVGGKQCIRTNEGYVIPLDIINGLPYMKMVPYTDKEWKELPHVVLTNGAEWDPTVLDNTLSDKDDWYNIVKEPDDGFMDTPFDRFGKYKHREPTEAVNVIPELDETEEYQDLEVSLVECFRAASNLNQVYINDAETAISASPEVEVKPTETDYEKYKHYILGDICRKEILGH
jgi:hypothetical protein